MGQPHIRSLDPRAGRSERRVVDLHGFIALEDGSSSQLTVLNLSYEGCRIATAAALTEGQPVKISVLRLGAIDAEVCWVGSGKAGLVFDPVPDALPGHAPRRSKRIELSAEVSLRRAGKHNYRVRAFDVSREGCKVEFIDRPDLGELIFIRFDGLEGLQAKACWIEGPRAGLEFVRPIHPAVFELLVARLG